MSEAHAPRSGATQRLQRPNIILFLTDDHGMWASGCYGNTEVQSPTLDSLAGAGALFRSAFAPAPTCSPARACLLTGRTPSQTGIHDWLQEDLPEIGDKDWLVNETTLPELLSQAGYYCGLSGKWHLGQSHKTPRGFDWCFGLPRNQGGHEGTYRYHLNGEPVDLTGNKSRLITDHAIDFLKTVPSDQPFFLNIGYIATHSPYEAEAHDAETVALYENAAFTDIETCAPHPWAHNEGFPSGEGTDQERRARYMGYYSAVTEIDRSVQRVLDEAARLGQLDNTLVIYTSDHGCSLGQQGFWGKGNSTRPENMYEISIRIPLLLRWPGQIAAGTAVAECVTHYDTFRTICSVAGVDLDPARNYPGRSLSELLQGQASSWDSTVYGEFGDLRMVRTPQWKLVKRYGHRPDELFDMRCDPHEKVNRAGQAETAEVQAGLADQLERFYESRQDPHNTGLLVSQYPPPNRHSPFHDGLRERAKL